MLFHNKNPLISQTQTDIFLYFFFFFKKKVIDHLKNSGHTNSYEREQIPLGNLCALVESM